MNYLSKKNNRILIALIISSTSCFIPYAFSEDIPKLKKTELWDTYGLIGYVSYSKGCEKETDNGKEKAFLSDCTIEIEGISNEKLEEQRNDVVWGSLYFIHILNNFYSKPIQISFEDNDSEKSVITREGFDSPCKKYKMKLGNHSEAYEYTTTSYLQLHESSDIFRQHPELLALSIALQPWSLLNFTNLIFFPKFIRDLAWSPPISTTLKVPSLQDISPHEVVLEHDDYSHGFRFASSPDTLEKVVIHNFRSHWMRRTDISIKFIWLVSLSGILREKISDPSPPMFEGWSGFTKSQVFHLFTMNVTGLYFYINPKHKLSDILSTLRKSHTDDTMALKPWELE